MRLHPAAREFYCLSITTTPAVTGWDASFDGGTTWQAGEVVDDTVRWLVAGPKFDATGATAATYATLTADVVPLLRATDNPERIVRSAPRIYVTN